MKAFGTKFDAGLRQFSADLLKSATFLHAASKGTEREKPVIQFFREHLPARFDVVTGEAIDLFERQSQQLDLMIYDKVDNFALYQGSSYILPAEALLASIEVKSVLTRQELEKSLKSATSLKRLRPFKRRVAGVRADGTPADGHARFFHAVFAYNSDLSTEGWMHAELARLSDVSTASRLNALAVDRIYVANRGMINTVSRIGFSDEADKGTGLMHLFMDLLNFLLREHDRRERVPYLEYAGRMTDGLVKL